MTRASGWNVGKSFFPLSWSTENSLLPSFFLLFVTIDSFPCIFSCFQREGPCFDCLLLLLLCIIISLAWLWSLLKIILFEKRKNNYIFKVEWLATQFTPLNQPLLSQSTIFPDSASCRKQCTGNPPLASLQIRSLHSSLSCIVTTTAATSLMLLHISNDFYRQWNSAHTHRTKIVVGRPKLTTKTVQRGPILHAFLVPQTIFDGRPKLTWQVW